MMASNTTLGVRNLIKKMREIEPVLMPKQSQALGSWIELDYRITR